MACSLHAKGQFSLSLALPARIGTETGQADAGWLLPKDSGSRHEGESLSYGQNRAQLGDFGGDLWDPRGQIL